MVIGRSSLDVRIEREALRMVIKEQKWLTVNFSGFGGLEVACWPLLPKFAGPNPPEAVGFFRVKKKPQHAFLPEGSKAVCPMSHICGM